METIKFGSDLLTLKYTVGVHRELQELYKRSQSEGGNYVNLTMLLVQVNLGDIDAVVQMYKHLLYKDKQRVKLSDEDIEYILDEQLEEHDIEEITDNLMDVVSASGFVRKQLKEELKQIKLQVESGGLEVDDETGAYLKKTIEDTEKKLHLGKRLKKK